MIPSYSLNNIPQDIPPFASLAGQDDCVNGYDNVFVTNYSDYENIVNMKDMGTHYIDSYYGLYGAIILKKSMTEKEYIEYLYSLRDYNWNFDISHSATRNANDNIPDNDITSSFNIQLDYTLYPIFDNHSNDVNYNTAEYLAPPARCLLNNNTNGSVRDLEHTWLKINSLSGAERVTNLSNTYGVNKTFLVLNDWYGGNYIFFRRVNIWARDYWSDGTNHGYFHNANTEAEREPFGYLGTGLVLTLPYFHVRVPYTANGQIYHLSHTCSFSTYYGNNIYGNDTPWVFTFDGEDYTSYFNTIVGLWDTNSHSASASVSTTESYFNFLDS